MASNFVERFDTVQIVDVTSVYILEEFDNALVHEDVIDPSPGDDGSFTKVGFCADTSIITVVAAVGEADYISLDSIDVCVVKIRSVAPIQFDMMHVCVLSGKACLGLMDRRKGYKCTSTARL